MSNWLVVVEVMKVCNSSEICVCQYIELKDSWQEILILDAKNAHAVDQANGSLGFGLHFDPKNMFHKMLFLLLEKLMSQTSGFVEW